MNIRRHRFARGHLWMLPVLVLVLLAAHGVVLYYVSSHMMLSAAALSGAIILMLMKHAGQLGRLYALFRRRRSPSCDGASSYVGCSK